MGRSFLLLLLFIQGCASPGPVTTVAIQHSQLRISYDREMKVPRYVVYELRRVDLQRKKFRRRDNFKADPYLLELKVEQVSGDVYRRSGFDRGHLAPAADFSWNRRALSESFYLSNITPQRPGLNRGPWKRLEDRVRRWACGEERLTVITGPLYAADPTLLRDELPIPESFFKIVVDETPPRKARAFVYHQNQSGSEVPVSDQRLIPVLDAFPEVASLGRSPAAKKDWKEKDCAR